MLESKSRVPRLTAHTEVKTPIQKRDSGRHPAVAGLQYYYGAGIIKFPELAEGRFWILHLPPQLWVLFSRRGVHVHYRP